MFLNAAVQRHWESKDSLVEETLKKLAQWFGKEALKPIHVQVQNWTQVPSVGGGPVANFPVGILSQLTEELDTPVGRIFFAGTEFSHESQGYMDGAICSGKRVSRRIQTVIEKGFNETSMSGIPFHKTNPVFEEIPKMFQNENNKYSINSNYKIVSENKIKKNIEIPYDKYGATTFELNYCILCLSLMLILIAAVVIKLF